MARRIVAFSPTVPINKANLSSKLFPLASLKLFIVSTSISIWKLVSFINKKMHTFVHFI